MTEAGRDELLLGLDAGLKRLETKVDRIDTKVNIVAGSLGELLGAMKAGIPEDIKQNMERKLERVS